MFLVVVISAVVLVEVVELIKNLVVFVLCSGLLSVTQTGRVSYGKASPGYVRIYDNFSRRAGCNCGASLCHAEVF